MLKAVSYDCFYFTKGPAFDTQGGGYGFFVKKEFVDKIGKKKNSLLYRQEKIIWSFVCKKKIDCWEPADLSKSAGNCQRAKISSLCSVLYIITAHWNEHQK